MKQLLIIFLLVPLLSLSQDLMEANIGATKTIDGTINEMLRIVNGEKGKTRNWEAFKELFLETANFTVVYFEQDQPYETATIEEMIEFMQDDYYNTGYKEEVLSRQIEKFNGIAHVFETVRHVEPDGNIALGLNSYQLVYGKNRWWIANIIWTTEDENSKIPDKFLKN